MSTRVLWQRLYVMLSEKKVSGRVWLAQRMDMGWCLEKGTLGSEADCLIHFLPMNSLIKYILSTYLCQALF